MRLVLADYSVRGNEYDLESYALLLAAARRQGVALAPAALTREDWPFALALAACGRLVTIALGS